jgi:tRNA (cytidine/uridine-2'-O-)-methyltransferase
MLEIVLFEPEIPQNTGNIARTCVAIGAKLHLIGQLGFSIEDRYLKRAGLDYWFDLDMTLWDHFDAFWEHINRTQDADMAVSVFYATTKGTKKYTDVSFTERTILVFGPESKGLPQSLLLARPERSIRIPMITGKRSLNLSNSVAIIAYEAMRQNGFADLC